MTTSTSDKDDIDETNPLQHQQHQLLQTSIMRYRLRNIQHSNCSSGINRRRRRFDHDVNNNNNNDRNEISYAGTSTILRRDSVSSAEQLSSYMKSNTQSHYKQQQQQQRQQHLLTPAMDSTKDMNPNRSDNDDDDAPLIVIPSLILPTPANLITLTTKSTNKKKRPHHFYYSYRMSLPVGSQQRSMYSATTLALVVVVAITTTLMFMLSTTVVVVVNNKHQQQSSSSSSSSSSSDTTSRITYIQQQPTTTSVTAAASYNNRRQLRTSSSLSSSSSENENGTVQQKQEQPKLHYMSIRFQDEDHDDVGANTDDETSSSSFTSSFLYPYYLDSHVHTITLPISYPYAAACAQSIVESSFVTTEIIEPDIITIEYNTNNFTRTFRSDDDDDDKTTQQQSFMLFIQRLQRRFPRIKSIVLLPSTNTTTATTTTATITNTDTPTSAVIEANDILKFLFLMKKNSTATTPITTTTTAMIEEAEPIMNFIKWKEDIYEPLQQQQREQQRRKDGSTSTSSSSSSRSSSQSKTNDVETDLIHAMIESTLHYMDNDRYFWSFIIPSPPSLKQQQQQQPEKQPTSDEEPDWMQNVVTTLSSSPESDIPILHYNHYYEQTHPLLTSLTSTNSPIIFSFNKDDMEQELIQFWSSFAMERQSSSGSTTTTRIELLPNTSDRKQQLQEQIARGIHGLVMKQQQQHLSYRRQNMFHVIQDSKRQQVGKDKQKIGDWGSGDECHIWFKSGVVRDFVKVRNSNSLLSTTTPPPPPPPPTITFGGQRAIVPIVEEADVVAMDSVNLDTLDEQTLSTPSLWKRCLRFLLYYRIPFYTFISSLSPDAIEPPKYALEYRKSDALSGSVFTYLDETIAATTSVVTNNVKSDVNNDDSNSNNYIVVHNPFPTARLLSLTYLTDADGMSYPKTLILLNDAPSVQIQPTHNLLLDNEKNDNNYNIYVTKTSNVGYILPHQSTIVRFVPLQETVLPFRLVGVSILAEEILSSNSSNISTSAIEYAI